LQNRRTNAMIVINEGYGNTLLFKDEIDLKNIIDDLNTELKTIRREKTKPPFLISFYSTGVTPEWMETHLTELKKRFTNAK